MSDDVECPYCGEEQEICHDDGYGTEEGEIHNQRCGSCSRKFVYTTSYTVDHEVCQADCLNGGEHQYKPVWHTPNDYPDWVMCSVCGHEERGDRILSEKELNESNN